MIVYRKKIVQSTSIFREYNCLTIFIQFATKLKEEHFAEIVNVDDGQEGKMSNDERLQWDQFLPMSKKEVVVTLNNVV